MVLTTLFFLELGVIGGLLGPASVGHLLFRRGEYEAAATWFRRAYTMSRIAPKRRVAMMCNLCACYVHLGDYAQAQPYAEDAIREAEKRDQHHTLAIAQLYYGVILIRLGDFDRALTTLTGVLSEIAPNSSMRPLAELYHASALLNNGRLEDAVKSAEALRQSPKIDPDIRILADYTLAECLYFAGKTPEALVVIKKAVESKPKAGWILPLLRGEHLLFLVETGRMMEAKEAEPKLMGILAKQTPSIQSAILRASALFALRSGDLDRARQRAGEACALDPNPNAQAAALLIQAEIFRTRHNTHRTQTLCEDIMQLNALAFYKNRAQALLDNLNTLDEKAPVEAINVDENETTRENHAPQDSLEPRD